MSLLKLTDAEDDEEPLFCDDWHDDVTLGHLPMAFMWVIPALFGSQRDSFPRDKGVDNVAENALDSALVDSALMLEDVDAVADKGGQTTPSLWKSS